MNLLALKIERSLNLHNLPPEVLRAMARDADDEAAALRKLADCNTHIEYVGESDERDIHYRVVSDNQKLQGTYDARSDLALGVVNALRDVG